MCSQTFRKSLYELAKVTGKILDRQYVWWFGELIVLG